MAHGSARLPLIAIGTAVLLWSTNFAISDEVLRTASPAVVSVGRFVIGLLVLVPIALKRPGFIRTLQHPRTMLLGLLGVAPLLPPHKHRTRPHPARHRSFDQRRAPGADSRPRVLYSSRKGFALSPRRTGRGNSGRSSRGRLEPHLRCWRCSEPDWARELRALHGSATSRAGQRGERAIKLGTTASQPARAGDGYSRLGHRHHAPMARAGDDRP
ncbi:DMT family transporter [Microbacterium oxydans]|nr:DMT family transporter [Microbacterium oxydans]